jgi:transcriptional regulator with XRE-family HTH domain
VILAGYLRRWRSIHDLTQAGAAERFGVARNTWARWERGELPLPAWLQKRLDENAGQDWYKEKLKHELEAERRRVEAAHAEAVRQKAIAERMKKKRPRREYARVDELLTEIAARDREIAGLKNVIAQKDDRIAELSAQRSRRARFRRGRPLLGEVEVSADHHRVADIRANCDSCHTGMTTGVHIHGGKPYCGGCCPACQ